MELSKSDVVLSLAGRDQGMLFFVVDTDGVYVSLVNGKERKLENPKRKKAKHVRKVPRPDSTVAAKLIAGDKLLNPGGFRNLAKDDVIDLEGIVTDALPNAMFKVNIGGGHTILAHISGKLRMNYIKILPGDKVTVQMSPYDLTQGRITWRSK